MAIYDDATAALRNLDRHHAGTAGSRVFDSPQRALGWLRRRNESGSETAAGGEPGTTPGSGAGGSVLTDPVDCESLQAMIEQLQRDINALEDLAQQCDDREDCGDSAFAGIMAMIAIKQGEILKYQSAMRAAGCT